MKLSDLSAALGVLSIALSGCSSTQHQIGEAAGGATGAAGSHDSGGESASGGAPDMAGASASAGDNGALGGGGSGGNGNIAGANGVAGAVSTGGSASVAGSGGASVAGSSSAGSGDIEASCTQSGGTVTTAICCSDTTDFPNLCLVGPCGCGPGNTHEIKYCSCPGTGSNCFDGHTCGHSLGASGGAAGNGG